MAGCPLGFGGVGVADEPQAAVGHAADVGPVGRAEGEEGFVPGGALVGCVVGGFGADRVGGVVVAVGFAVGADRGCLVLPFLPGGRVVGYGAESGDGPGERVVGGELADPLFAVVHHGRDLGQVLVALRVGQVGHAIGPGALRPGEQRVDALADPGVDDAGDVAGAGEVAGFDGRAGDLARGRGRPARRRAGSGTAICACGESSWR